MFFGGVITIFEAQVGDPVPRASQQYMLLLLCVVGRLKGKHQGDKSNGCRGDDEKTDMTPDGTW